MFKNIILIIFVIAFFLGCSRNMPDYSSKEYKNINKDAVLNAAKRVILLADKDYLVHTKRNSIEAEKVIANYQGFDVNILINNIEFKAVQEDNITKAKLKLTVQKDYLSTKQKVIKNNAHDLFWNRLEYILGLNKNWYSCTKYLTTFSFDGIFCNLLHNDNITPTQATILSDITITKQQIITNEENISLATIDLSALDNIKLPIKSKEEVLEKEENNNSLNIDIEINESNITEILPTIIEKPTTIEVNSSTKDTNSSNELNSNEPVIIEESNITEITLDLSNEEENTNIDNSKETNNSKIADEVNDITNETKTPTIKERNNTNIQPNISEQNSTNHTNTLIRNNKKEINTDFSYLTGFAKKFMEADPLKYYTINLALLKTELSTQLFLNRHKIKNNAFAIKFTKDGKTYIKIVYGLYPSKSDAKKAIKNLPKELISNNPTVEGIGRKQTLFKTNDINLSKNIYKTINSKTIK